MMTTDWHNKGWADAVVYTYECPNCGICSDVHIGDEAGGTVWAARIRKAVGA